MVNIVAIIQARMNSKRLPNKVLKNLPFCSSKSLLMNIVDRLKLIKKINKIIVATTNKTVDDSIEEYCLKNNILCFRGSEENVLKRYYEAAKFNEADIVLRFTGDNPVIDTFLIEEALTMFINTSNTDYLRLKGVPIGMGVEIFSFKALEKNFQNSISTYEKEHVTPYFYKTNPQNFKIIEITKKYETDISNIRLTVDSKEDYNFMCILFDELYSKNNYFGIFEILELKERKPWIFELNSYIEQKKVFVTLDEEIEEAKKLLKKQDLNKAYDFIVKNYNNTKN